MKTYRDITLLVSSTLTSSGDTKSDKKFVGDCEELNVFLDVTAINAANTLDVRIVTQDPLSGEWFTLITFEAATAVDNGMGFAMTNLGRYIAVEYDVGGSAPLSVTCSIEAVAKG